MASTAREIGKAAPPMLRARKRFGKYKDMAEESVRKPVVREDKDVKIIEKLWNGCGLGRILKEEQKNKRALTLFGQMLHFPPEIRSSYTRLRNKLSSRINPDDITAEKIQKFSIALEEHSHEKNYGIKAGLFLTALMELSRETEFILNSVSPIDCLGAFSSKKITVIGNVGDFLGAESYGAVIIVEGDAEYGTGIGMRNSKITVSNTGELGGAFTNNSSFTVLENAGPGLGSHMNGGVILLKGNAAGSVGDGMKDGLIVIEGNVGIATPIFPPKDPTNIGNMLGGRVIVKGEIDGDITGKPGGELHIHGKVLGKISPNAGNVVYKGAFIGSGVTATDIVSC